MWRNVYTHISPTSESKASKAQGRKKNPDRPAFYGVEMRGKNLGSHEHCAADAPGSLAAPQAGFCEFVQGGVGIMGSWLERVGIRRTA